MKSAFSKTWQPLTSKIWSLPEVLATAVARVNIKPTTPFCTISQEISQWISTATGNNGSQLQQPVVTLDIPVPSGPVLSVEMRKSPTLLYTFCPGSRFQSHSLHRPLSPTPSPGCLWMGSSLLVLWEVHAGSHAPAWKPVKSHRETEIPVWKEWISVLRRELDIYLKRI